MSDRSAPPANDPPAPAGSSPVTASPARTRRDQTLLAFDYGERRIGVAVGQTVTATARPLETLQSKQSRPDWERIGHLLTQWQPDAVVLGLPLDAAGGEQELTRRTRRFQRQLEGRYGVTVHLVDERYTTREASERLGPGAAKNDAVAATVILEDYLRALP